jgi:hypothetical protein
LQSGFYHQLSVTAHAPLAKKPELFNIRLTEHPHRGFARNALPFKYLDDVTRNEKICERMIDALELFQRRIALDEPLEESWFDGLDMPRTMVAPSFVEDAMKQPHPGMRTRDRVVWLGGVPSWSRGQLTVRASDGAVYSRAFPRSVADSLRRCHPDHWEDQPPMRSDFESSDWIDELRPLGLVLV